MEESTQVETETPSLSDNDVNTSEASREERYFVAEQRRSAFIGPLPPPEILAKYENAYPGAAEKIFQMAQDQARHRRTMEEKSLKLASRDANLGIITGFIVAIAGIAGGIFIVYLNPASAINAIAGSAVSGSSLIGLVRTFVVGAKNQNKKQDNADNNDSPE